MVGSKDMESFSMPESKAARISLARRRILDKVRS